MASVDTVVYNAAAFITALFLLELGADKFVDHTAIVARRTGIPDTIIALLTAGAEWEELLVVIFSLAQGRSGLAIGNIVGSAISNILGAFSLGLLFRQDESPTDFDRSSRIYAALLLGVTTLATPAAYFQDDRAVSMVCGAALITVFIIYLISIAWAISRGSLSAPEGSDSDSDSDDDDLERDIEHIIPDSQHRRETDALLPRPAHEPSPLTFLHRGRRSVMYHVIQLIFGFLAISLAGYVLSHAAVNILAATGMSEVLFGVVILAIATTLPEKFVAVLSGSRGHMGILAANTAGSNVFLLTLCLGIVLVRDTSKDSNLQSIKIHELAVIWACTLAFTATVYISRKFHWWIGGAMVLGYITFIILEFTIVY